MAHTAQEPAPDFPFSASDSAKTRNSSAPPVDFDLAIVGGGITGLSLALSIHHNTSIPVVIYEAAAKFGEIGAGVSFGPNARRALSLISPEVHQGFERRGSRNENPEKATVWFDFWLGMDGPNGAKDGDWMYAVYQPSPPGASVHRAHFLDEMVRLVPEGIARFGKRLREIEHLGAEGVLLKFEDGSTAKHGAVVGCDGIHSRTRQLVLGPDNPASHAVFSGKYCYRGLIPMDKAIDLLGPQMAQNAQMYCGYHGHVLTFPIEKGKTMNVVAFTSRDKWEHDKTVISATKEHMYKDYEGWGKNVSSILELMQKPDIWALFDHLPAETYQKGRVLLAGDAAHASTPHQGAGAGMAVEDSYVLSMILKEVRSADQLDAAFRAFDTVRKPRTQKLVKTSRIAGTLYDFEQEGVGDDLEKIKEQLSVRMKWIWYHNVQDDVDAALRMLREDVEKR